jgi:hypothetical protein
VYTPHGAGASLPDDVLHRIDEVVPPGPDVDAPTSPPTRRRLSSTAVNVSSAGIDVADTHHREF